MFTANPEYLPLFNYMFKFVCDTSCSLNSLQGWGRDIIKNISGLKDNIMLNIMKDLDINCFYVVGALTCMASGKHPFLI